MHQIQACTSLNRPVAEHLDQAAAGDVVVDHVLGQKRNSRAGLGELLEQQGIVGERAPAERQIQGGTVSVLKGERLASASEGDDQQIVLLQLAGVGWNPLASEVFRRGHQNPRQIEEVMGDQGGIRKPPGDPQRQIQAMFAEG